MNWTIEAETINQGQYVLSCDQCSETIDQEEKFWVMADETGELYDPICQACMKRLLNNDPQGGIEGTDWWGKF